MLLNYRTTPAGWSPDLKWISRRVSSHACNSWFHKP